MVGDNGGRERRFNSKIDHLKFMRTTPNSEINGTIFQLRRTKELMVMPQQFRQSPLEHTRTTLCFTCPEPQYFNILV